MAQHDYVIANGTGAAVRSDLNNALAAIVSQNSGATAPATTYAYQFWADTTTNLLKLRNSANSAWITLFQLDGEWSTLPVENGTAAAPSIYFKDSGTDTGFYSPGTDQVGISTGGTARLTIDANGNLAVDTNSLYVDAANNRVGIGTSSPGAILDLTATAGAGGQTSVIRFGLGATAESWIGVANSAGNIITNSAQGDTVIRNDGGKILLSTDSGTTAHAVIDSSGRLGIGSTSVQSRLHVKSGAANYTGGLLLESSANDSGTFLWHDGTKTVLESSYLSSGSYTPITFQTSNTERVRIDTSGRLLVGTSTSAVSYSDWRLQISGQAVLGSYLGATTSAYNFNFIKSRSSSVGTYTIVASGDKIGGISFNGDDGTDYETPAASIEAFVDGTPGANDMPGRLVFSTTADGASSPTERARITNSGFFKATSTGAYENTAGLYHELRNNTNNEALAIFTHTGTSGSQYGLLVRLGSDQNDATRYFYRGTGDATERFTVRSNGGIANYSANNTNLSDINTKKDITPAAGTWDCIKEWEIVNYRYKDQPDDADLNLGVIAQQVAESCPEVITVYQEAKEATETEPAQEERLGIKEQQMYWMAIKALQEAQVRIEALEAKVAALESA